MKLLKQSRLFIWSVAIGIFSIPSVFFLLSKGFFTTDDGSWMIIRFGAFYTSLADGQLPVRFLKGLNFGYGYPVANFLYPGFMYLATPFHIMGFGLVTSIKIILILSISLSGIFTFIWLRTFFGNISSFLGALVYIYTPYHLYDVYKRGSVGEVLALTFVPLALFGIEKRIIPVISLAVFLLIISHNTMALLFLPIIIIYAFLNRSTFKRNFLGIVLGLLLSSFFIIPAVTELGLTYFRTITISDPLQYFANINLIGISSFCILILAIGIFFYSNKNGQKIENKKPFIFFVSVSTIGILLSIPLSGLLWKTSFNQFIQFPFRILSVLLLSSAYLSAYGSHLIKSRLKYIFCGAILVLLFYSSANFLKPQDVTNTPDEVYLTNPSTTTIKNEYMPLWVKQFPTKEYLTKVIPIGGSAKIDNIIEKSNNISFDVVNNSSTSLILNTIYYPGWSAYVDGKIVPISYNNNKGVIQIPLRPDSSRIQFKFSETPVRLMSDLLTILGFGILINLSVMHLKKR